jgi:hypothetical protein
MPELHKLPHRKAGAEETVSENTQLISELHHLPHAALIAKHCVLCDR